MRGYFVLAGPRLPCRLVLGWPTPELPTYSLDPAFSRFPFSSPFQPLANINKMQSALLPQRRCSQSLSFTCGGKSSHPWSRYRVAVRSKMEEMPGRNIMRPLEPSRASQTSSGVSMSGCTVYAPQNFVCTSVQPHHGLVLGRLIQCSGPSRKNLFLTFLSL